MLNVLEFKLAIEVVVVVEPAVVVITFPVLDCFNGILVVKVEDVLETEVVIVAESTNKKFK